MPSGAGNDEDLGLKGLISLLDEVRTENLEDLISEVTSAVLKKSGSEAFKDDLCLIGIKYHAS